MLFPRLGLPDIYDIKVARVSYVTQTAQESDVDAPGSEGAENLGYDVHCVRELRADRAQAHLLQRS